MLEYVQISVFSHSSSPEGLGGADQALLELLRIWNKDPEVSQINVVSKIPQGLLQKNLNELGIEHNEFEFEFWLVPEKITNIFDQYRSVRNNVSFLLEAVDLLKNSKPDVVLSNTMVSPWGALAAYICHVPHIWYVHENGDVLESEFPLEDLKQDIATLSSLVIVASEELQQNYTAGVKTIVRAPISQWLRELPAQKVRQKSSNDNHESQMINIALIGPINESKGQFDAVRCLPRLNTLGKQIKLNFFGDVSSQTVLDIQNFLKSEGLSNSLVVFHGYQTDIVPFLSQMTFGLNASRSEGFGRATLEMLGLGLPVIATDIPAHKKFIDDGKNGFLYHPGDIDKLCELITLYSLNSSLLKENSVNAQKMAKNFIDNNYTEIELRISELESVSSPIKLSFTQVLENYPKVIAGYLQIVDDTHLSPHDTIFHSVPKLLKRFSEKRVFRDIAKPEYHAADLSHKKDLSREELYEWFLHTSSYLKATDEFAKTREQQGKKLRYSFSFFVARVLRKLS